MPLSASSIPPSLNNGNPATAVPLYFKLDIGTTPRWKEIALEDITNVYSFLLPPPKSGLNYATVSYNQNDVNLWQTGIMDSIKSSATYQLIFGSGKETVSNFFGQKDEKIAEMKEDISSVLAGGGGVPKDLTRIQYRGNSKRAYQFGFDLIAYTEADAVAIKDFIRIVNAASLTRLNYTEETRSTYPFYIPGFFTFSILNAGGGAPGQVPTDITKNFFLDPKPCHMTSVTVNTLQDYGILTSDNVSGRYYLTINLSEIEPIAWSGPWNTGDVVMQFEVQSDCKVE